MIDDSLRDISDSIIGLSPRVVSGQNARGRFQLLVAYRGTRSDSSMKQGYCHSVAAVLPEFNGRRIDAEIGVLDFTLEQLDRFSQLYIAETRVRESYRGHGIFTAMYEQALAIGHCVFPAGLRVFLEVSRENEPMTAFVRSREFQRQGHAGDLVDYARVVPPKYS